MADSLQSLLSQFQVTTQNKYISQEFQEYAYRLAMALDGETNAKTVGMCMRLVKRKPRALLEQAHSFIQDAKARNKVALFLWKLKQLEIQSQPKVSQED